MGYYLKFVNDWKRLVKMAKDTPNEMVNVSAWSRVSVSGYNGQISAKEARQVMLDKLNRKISQHDPRNLAYYRSSYKSFRKYADNDLLWQYWRDRKALQDAQTKRTRVYQFETKFYRENFSHMLASSED